ncbi:MAG: hypothetical protein Q8Q10_00470 [bacterium]|nr:hypothetical protein [bacterium]
MNTPTILKIHRSQILLSLLFIGGLLLILFSFYNTLSFPDTSYNFLGASGKAKLDSGKPITQVFTAKENNLNQVKIIGGNFDLMLREKIVFELADSGCEAILASQSANFLTPSPHIYYRFNFPAIPDSAGKKYCFRVTYFSPIDRGDERPYLAISEGERFRGQSYINEGNNRIYENRTLQMRPAYTVGSFPGDLGRLNDRISQYKPEFLKGSALTIIFCAFIVSTISLVWLLVFRKED